MQHTSTLNPRRQALLDIIVGDYIRTATPVASQQIVHRHDMKVSPATIRNDMAELEEMGYISRSHASAGAVPGDLAYRFYVERATLRARPSRGFEMLVQGAISADTGDPEAWAHRATMVLSHTLRNGAIATAPRVSTARVKQLQLVHIHDKQALLVLVLQEARLRQRMVHLAEPVDQDQLTGLAARLNTALVGKNALEVRAWWDGGRAFGADAEAVTAEVQRLLDDEDSDEPQRHYTDGLRHMLDQPEFQSGERARDAVQVLEDDASLLQVMEESLAEGDVDVVIGEESRRASLRPYSLVISRYGSSGHSSGVIGAVGPTRMDYTQAIASVRYLADFLTRLVSSLDEPGS
jgi:heat-inducible transcriptional repressor